MGQTNAEFKSPDWTAEAEVFSAMRRSAEEFRPFRSGRDVLQSPAARGEFSGTRLFQDELQLVMRFSWSGVLFPTRNIRLTITRELRGMSTDFLRTWSWFRTIDIWRRTSRRERPTEGSLDDLPDRNTIGKVTSTGDITL